LQLGIIRGQDQGHVSSVLSAAALTCVAATLQSVVTLAYFLFRFAGVGSDE